MENIYRAWTDFNKMQNSVFATEKAAQLLEKVDESVNRWKDCSYPKGEEWRYVKYKNLPTAHLKLVEADFANRQVADENFLSFEVQNFRSPQQFDKLSLPQGIEIESDVESMNLELSQTDSNNPFTELSKSFYGLGFTLKVKKSFLNKKPIKLLFNLDQFKEKDLFVQQNIKVLVEAGAEADIFVETQAESWSGLSNISLDFYLEENSRVHFYNKEKGGPQSHCVMNLSTAINKQALFKSLDFTFPSLWSRHNFSADLLGEGSEVALNGAYLNNNNYFVDHHTSIRHSVGQTTSLEDYRGILADQSQAVFNGRVYIAEKAEYSNSDQINKNLMLSSQAEVDTKPELQIYNDNVKAAHGATVGQLDEEQRFYLQSRGYDKEMAGRVLSRAFVFELIDNESEAAKEFYQGDLDRVLSQLEES